MRNAHKNPYHTIGHHPDASIPRPAFIVDLATEIQDPSCTWVLVPLYKFGKVVAYSAIDKGDVHLLGHGRWGAQTMGRTTYAYKQQHVPGTTNGNIVHYLHQAVVGLKPGGGRKIHADHVNHDGLDNRRSNLRVVTRQENLQNRRASISNVSGVAGVAWVPNLRPNKRRPGTRAGYWSAYLYRDGRYVHRSSHDTMEKAVAARLQAERDYEAAKAKETA